MIPALNAAILSKLKGTGGTATAAGTAIYYLQAPDGAALPYVVFDYTSDLDENMTQNRTKNSLLFIRGYSTSAAGAGTIDGQVDTLLHNQTLTVTGYTNFWTARESAYSTVETDDAGAKTYMSGAEYRIRLDT